jgi:heme-degrading monooxygenase HmoA
MQQSIIIRVVPENFDIWRKEHDGQQEARLAYGITDEPFYRDERDPNVALVHLNVENLDRAMKWFKSDAFREAAKRAGSVQREIWLAQKRGQ